MSNDRGFQSVVAVWLRQQGEDVASVDGVETSSTDWAGSTEGGFYSESSVIIKFTRADGRTADRYIDGEDMGSLWKHVMEAWPA